ncbi:hypothetical protein [Salinarimonas sp.]|uniref:hypothetical protein n=1 Tax=Salinarimonas sp. TaxID=2766526 RepID=UPI0032D935A7
MNDDETDRRDDRARAETESERPAVVAYDPYFPASRGVGDGDRLVPFDPYFSSDGSSDFD